MADFTSPDEIDHLAGTTGVDLRTDDADVVDVTAEAILYAGGELEFSAQGKYSNLDTLQWIRNVATAFALEYLCQRRLNSVPESLAERCERYRKKLELVEAGKLVIPGATRSRRPVTVTNSNVDLRRANNQVRVDKSRSTGVARNYPRVVDEVAPDQR